MRIKTLEGCPCCESYDVSVEETDSGVGGLHGEYYVICWACYLQTGKHPTKREAKLAWNRRPANEEPRNV